MAVVAAAVIAGDQVTKTLAVDRLTNGPVHVIGPFSFDLAYNTGIAFSLFTGFTLPIVIVVAAIVGLVGFSARSIPSLRGSVGIGLVLGGSLGNLADRLFRGRGGAVVDFIHTSFWPTFNVADSAIVIGCVLIASVVWHRPHRRSPRAAGT
jgi:signal peptidase II